MTLKSNRKSGIRAKRRREAKRLWRDREIYRFLRYLVTSARQRHYNVQAEIEPLSVYLPKRDHRHHRYLNRFPVEKQVNGRPMPDWNDLSAWLKMQLAVMLLDEWELQTFNIHIHPDLERQWMRERRDPRVMMRDRLRRELDRRVRSRLEHFFVIEGWSKLQKAPTLLHIHGAAAIYPGELRDARNIMIAAARAAGHGLKGYSKQPRAVNGRMFTREGPAYINYLFKSVRRKDPRLSDRRFTMSRSATEGARELWNTITGRIHR